MNNLKYVTTFYNGNDYRTIDIKRIDEKCYVSLHYSEVTNEWTITDLFVEDFYNNQALAKELIDCTKHHTKYISINLTDNTSQWLIDFFRLNKIRIKLQINFDYE